MLDVGWTQRGSIPCRGGTFRLRPHRRRGPPSLLYNGYCVFPGGKAAGAWSWPPPSPLLVPRLSVGRAVPAPPFSACLACYGTALTYVSYRNITLIHYILCIVKYVAEFQEISEGCVNLNHCDNRTTSFSTRVQFYFPSLGVPSLQIAAGLSLTIQITQLKPFRAKNDTLKNREFPV